MTLTRKQFEDACKSFIRKCKSGDKLNQCRASWTWNEHTSIPGLGYMSRTMLIPHEAQSYDSGLSGEDAEECGASEILDAATALSLTASLITTRLYVVYSSTFQVPALYFSVHHSNGTPLTLVEIIHLPLFLPQALPDEHNGSFSLNVPDSSFALLSQGDHPTLGTPCWYLHPCHTSEVVSEIMSEVDCSEWDDAQRSLRWLEAWFMVLGNIIVYPKCSHR